MILCTGAQKAGTTWLFDYFQKHPEIGVPAEKELRVFDSAMLPFQRDLPAEFTGGRLFPVMRDRLKEAISILEKANVKSDMVSELSNNHHIKRALEMMYVYTDMKHFTSYLDWMEYKLIGKKYVADITPTYSLLDDTNTGAMAGYLRKRFDTKVVYLVRDPIDRIVSWAHMINRLDNEKMPVVTGDAILAAANDHPLVRKHSDYKNNIIRLQTMFGKDNVYVDTMERFISSTGIQKFTEWLSIEYMKPDCDRYHNASANTPIVLNHRVIDELKQLYDEDYKFCDDLIDLGEYWRNFNGK